MVRRAGAGFNVSPMLEQLERCEAYLVSIDEKLGVIADCCLKLVPDYPAGTPPVPDPEPVLRDAEYTRNRVGISESTLLRCQQRGEIEVAKRAKGKKYFRDEDVERLRKSYRGIE